MKFEKKLKGYGIIKFHPNGKGEIEAVTYKGGKLAHEYMLENGLEYISGECETCYDLDGDEYLKYHYGFNY